MNLNIHGTTSSPEIEADWENGVLAMRGDSYPENSYEFYGRVLEWVERYLASSGRPLQLELRLMYLNTSSIKVMMDLFDRLEDVHQSGRSVRVTWYYDPRNERVAELADEFREDCSFPFDITAGAALPV
ncbi:biofilm regulation phosphoprotein SiaC [Massilia sp. TS11]|uniref:biofilm regulation phosphoprotein SiaC n=1 Tax=Massilia sp. TS11 TaxID=2908003 RepID=UPI001EDB3D06|nr:biofilm regulation phosphoprotein SiaC [Massilia sp. TS11]MCG2586889.1 biofilm regulation phosphoprotein SiaC [Massilia sp. TS11]